MKSMSKRRVLLSVILILLPLSQAFATWSIVAVDPETGEVGSAGASWSSSVWAILGIAGGKGVLVAQAESNEEARVLALEMLVNGEIPADIISTITNSSFDADFSKQQYGIVSLRNGSASFTGENNPSWSGHIGDDRVMILGNTLEGEEVIKNALEAYKKAEAENLPLSHRLTAALVAGSQAGGDSRAHEELTAMTAYLAVAEENDKPGYASLAITIPPSRDGTDPVEKLEKALTDKDFSPGRFPSIRTVVGVAVVIPIAAGLLVSLLLLRTFRKKKIRFSYLLSVLFSFILPVILHLVVKSGASLFNIAMPLHGTAGTIILLSTGAIPLLLLVTGTALVLGVKFLKR